MDIVDRLKDAAKIFETGRRQDKNSLLRVAAAEIEALRNAIEPIVNGGLWISTRNMKRAKKVLGTEGKKVTNRGLNQ